MATQFTSAEWKRIREKLEADPERYGLPQREYGSVLIGSFNQQSDGSILIACKSLLMRALKN